MEIGRGPFGGLRHSAGRLGGPSWPPWKSAVDPSGDCDSEELVKLFASHTLWKSAVDPSGDCDVIGAGLADVENVVEIVL